MSKLEGKVAAITGGNSGLGLAIAKRFRAEGAAVAIMGRNSETLESAVAEIGEGTVSSMGDVQSLSDLDEFFSKISEHFGSLDIIVANAGGGKNRSNLRIWGWAAESHLCSCPSPSRNRVVWFCEGWPTADPIPSDLKRLFALLRCRKVPGKNNS